MSLLTDALTRPDPKQDDTAESAITELKEELDISGELDATSRDPTVQTKALDELMLEEFEAARQRREDTTASAMPVEASEDPEPLEFAQTDVLSEDDVLAAQSIVLEALPEEAPVSPHDTLEILHEPPTLTDADSADEPTRVFMPEAETPRAGSRSKRIKLVGGGLAMVAIGVVAGAYFFSQPEEAIYTGTAAPADAPGVLEPTPLSSLEPGSATVQANAQPAADPAEMGPPLQARPEFEREPATPADLVGFAAAAERAAVTEQAEPAERTTIEIATTRTQSPVFLALNEAYTYLQRGEFAAAEDLYEKALTLDPKSVDALLGIAAIKHRGGSVSEAQNFYRMALSLDPRNSVAAAGLMSLRESFARVESESELKSMLAEQSEAAHLHFALGLHYVSQSRWPDAQQSFFQAVRYDPANADYAFNLAVSLDRLGQRQAAAKYYRRAIERARGAHKFDLDAARGRLETLSAGS